MTVKKTSGQVVIILLLIMLVALSAILSLSQRALNNVTSSTQNEQSSRAFSAAEAGIQRAIQLCTPGQACTVPSVAPFQNQASTNLSISNPLPPAGTALEYPPREKEDIIQFWFADPSSNNNPPPTIYTANSLNLYFGAKDPVSTNKPAIEFNVISWNGSNYISTKFYFDSDSTRSGSSGNGFTAAASVAGSNCNNTSVTNASSTVYYCKVVVTGLPSNLILARARILYSNTAQNVAIEPTSGSLPPQASIYTSQGSSGLSQKTVKVFRIVNVTPFLFDYSIFSAGAIVK